MRAWGHEFPLTFHDTEAYKIPFFMKLNHRYLWFLLFLQKVSSCLAEHPLCKGPSVNLFRLWVLRETKLEKRLNICPDVDSKDLENSVSNTGKIARKGNCFALVVIILKPFFLRVQRGKSQARKIGLSCPPRKSIRKQDSLPLSRLWKQPYHKKGKRGTLHKKYK